MPFDLSSASPVSSGFDLSSATPVEEVAPPEFQAERDAILKNFSASEGMPSQRGVLDRAWGAVTGGRNLGNDLQFVREATALPSLSDIGGSISKEAQSAAQFAKEGGESAVANFKAGQPLSALAGAGQQLLGGAGVVFSPVTGLTNAVIDKAIAPTLGENAADLTKIAADLFVGPKSGGLITKPLGVIADIPKSVNELRDLLKNRKSEAEINNLVKDFYSGQAEEELFPGRVIPPKQMQNLKNEAAAAPPPDVTGQSMLDAIKENIDPLREQRKAVAKITYGKANESMAAKHDAGNFWQESPTGEKFISSLENQISTIKETKETKGVRDQLRGLVRDLQGEPIPETVSPILDALGNPITTAESGVAYSRPEVLREVLRKLRDAAKGHPEEGLAAIEQARAGDLANELAASISGWDENLAIADEKYREASKLLYPTVTKRGKSALAGEKFDIAQLAADPASVPDKFFKSKQGVQQFTDLVGGNKQAVEQAATQHVMRKISEMEPDAALKFLRDNNGWLNYEMLPQTMAKVAPYIRQRQYESMVAPIRDMITKYEKGLIPSADVPNAIRTILARPGTSVEASREIAQQINKIEQIQDKEKRAQAMLAAVKKTIFLAGGVAVGGQLIGRPIINHLAPSNSNSNALAP